MTDFMCDLTLVEAEDCTYLLALLFGEALEAELDNSLEVGYNSHPSYSYTNNSNNTKEDNPMAIEKNHQTAVFVRTSADSNSDYEARAHRFVDSLNRGSTYEGYGNDSGSTIKADVYSVDENGKISSGLVWEQSRTAGHVSYATAAEVERAGYRLVRDPDAILPTPVSDSQLRELAREAGYVQSSIISD